MAANEIEFGCREPDTPEPGTLKTLARLKPSIGLKAAFQDANFGDAALAAMGVN